VYYEILHMRKMHGDDKYVSKEPVVGTTRVKLRFPPNFEVGVSCKTVPLVPATENDPPMRYSFEWNEAILPYQGVTITWSKKEVERGAQNQQLLAAADLTQQC